MSEPKTIKINEVEYIRKDSIPEIPKTVDGMVIVRTHSAGCFFGRLEDKNGKEVELSNARRLWYWKGAASLSQMAVDGVSCPNECKFPTPVQKIFLTEAIEIIPCTEKAVKSISEVPVWKR